MIYKNLLFEKFKYRVINLQINKKIIVIKILLIPKLSLI